MLLRPMFQTLSPGRLSSSGPQASFRAHVHSARVPVFLDSHLWICWICWRLHFFFGLCGFWVSCAWWSFWPLAGLLLPPSVGLPHASLFALSPMFPLPLFPAASGRAKGSEGASCPPLPGPGAAPACAAEPGGPGPPAVRLCRPYDELLPAGEARPCPASDVAREWVNMGSQVSL